MCQIPNASFGLYIQASSIDKDQRGAGLKCQQFSMMAHLLSRHQDGIDVTVHPAQAESPPSFLSGVSWSNKLPVVMVTSGTDKSGKDISHAMYDSFEELENFFDVINVNYPLLTRSNLPNQTAVKITERLYRGFGRFMKNEHAEDVLLTELQNLNDYLEAQTTKFLVDNRFSFADCHLLPRLQHIRVAGRAFRWFEIPTELTFVWRYLALGYQQHVFTSCMPSDEDIVAFYVRKLKISPMCLPHFPMCVPEKKSLCDETGAVQKLTYTTDTPIDCLLNTFAVGCCLDVGDGGQISALYPKESATIADKSLSDIGQQAQYPKESATIGDQSLIDIGQQAQYPKESVTIADKSLSDIGQQSDCSKEENPTTTKQFILNPPLIKLETASQTSEMDAAISAPEAQEIHLGAFHTFHDGLETSRATRTSTPVSDTSPHYAYSQRGTLHADGSSPEAKCITLDSISHYSEPQQDHDRRQLESQNSIRRASFFKAIGCDEFTKGLEAQEAAVHQSYVDLTDGVPASSDTPDTNDACCRICTSNPRDNELQLPEKTTLSTKCNEFDTESHISMCENTYEVTKAKAKAKAKESPLDIHDISDVSLGYVMQRPDDALPQDVGLVSAAEDTADSDIEVTAVTVSVRKGHLETTWRCMKGQA